MRGEKEGYVKQTFPEIILSKQSDELGYLYVNVMLKHSKQTSVPIHVLVAMSWEAPGYEKRLEDPKEYTVDHFPDRDPSNNALENLRYATKSQQKHNSWIQRNNESGYRGVCVDLRPALGRAVYRYQIQINKVRYASHDNGGPKYYETAEEAARERDIRIIELEEEGKIGIGDTPLNFPEIRFEISMERWPVAM